jgi:hypothetical protein
MVVESLCSEIQLESRSDRFAWALDELELDGAQIDAMTDRRDGSCRRPPDGIIGSHESSNPHYC